MSQDVSQTLDLVATSSAETRLSYPVIIIQCIYTTLTLEKRAVLVREVNHHERRPNAWPGSVKLALSSFTFSHPFFEGAYHSLLPTQCGGLGTGWKLILS